MDNMGVSATHLDWTTVLYVRKSFFKHYNDGMLWCENADDYCAFKKEEKYNNTLSIEDKLYKRYKKAYDYAMAQTIKETHQAAEGLYHNLSN